MTRPTPTQGAQSEAARVPRVSDRRVRDCALDPPSTLSDIALDLLDERRDHASARQASRDKDATIADLERRLAEAERERDAAYIQGVKEGAAAMSERD